MRDRVEAPRGELGAVRIRVISISESQHNSVYNPHELDLLEFVGKNAAARRHAFSKVLYIVTFFLEFVGKNAAESVRRHSFPRTPSFFRTSSIRSKYRGLLKMYARGGILSHELHQIQSPVYSLLTQEIRKGTDVLERIAARG